MFEFDAGKFLIIGIVALVVIGPKELPRVMRQVGQAVARLRRLSSEFQAQFMEAMREADLEEVREEAAKIAAAAKFDQGIDPLAGVRAELTQSLEASPQPPVDATLPVHTDPLAEALHEAPPAAEAAIDASIAARVAIGPAEAAPLADAPEAIMPQEISQEISQEILQDGEQLPVSAPHSADVTPLRKRG